MELAFGFSGDSLIHRLDPRTKLAWLVINILLLLLQPPLPLSLTILILLLLTSLIAKLPLRRFWPLLKIGLIIAIQLMILQGFLHSGGRSVELWNNGPRLWEAGALLGLGGSLNLLCLALACLQFQMWTTPGELSLLMMKLGLPARYAFCVGLALRFIPLLEKDLRSVFESQQVRGLPLETVRQKIKGLPPIILPFILRTLRRAESVAMAMELKAFGAHSQITHLSELKLTFRDLTALTAITLYACAAFYYRY